MLVSLFNYRNVSVYFFHDITSDLRRVQAFLQIFDKKTKKMVTKRRGKRKSPSAGLIFEVNDDDVSPDNSDNDCNEPNTKILKTDSKFVESVVNALSNLEDQEKLETKDDKESLDETEIDISVHSDKSSTCVENLEKNSSCDLLDCISPDANFVEPETQKNDVDFEEGEIAVENIDEKDSADQTIQISFSNESISTLYKSKFIHFINTFNELQIVKEDELSFTLKRSSNNWITLDQTGFVDSILLPDETETNLECITEIASESLNNEKNPNKKRKRKRTKKAKELFVLDTTPSQHESASCAKYKSKFNIEINDNNDEEEVRMSNQICFNCEQGHALKDCPLPRDHAKINMMRQRFKKDKHSSRYHLEEEQKYAHLRPGKISDKLREALGIKKNQLPPYLYQMRKLGYPPGWLEEAKFVYSNLELFDSEGKNVRAEHSKNQGLDSAKIVEYPGFNVPMEAECKDEFRQYRVPPYSENYSKAVMIDYFEKEYSKQQDDFQTQDMEIDVDDTSDKEETKNDKLCVRKTTINDVEKDAPSPSLVDLETQKQTLLAALDDTSNSNLKSEENTNDASGSEQPKNSKDTNNKILPPEDDVPEGFVEKEDTVTEQESIMEVLEVTSNEDFSFYESINTKPVKNSSFGTPIIKSSSPYSRLPNPDNFMKDVSPVINFENLPNSTGKYEQMTGLLQKVRNTMKKKQKCDAL